MTPLLEVRDLRIAFPTGRGTIRPVDGVSFTLERGRTLAVVGESEVDVAATARSFLFTVAEAPRDRHAG